MSDVLLDPRVRDPHWDAAPPQGGKRARLRLVLLLTLPLALFYFGWLLQPERIGNPILFGLLAFAELFNVFQALGFWWTASADRGRPEEPPVPRTKRPVDVFVPVYGEPVEIVELTIAAATRMRGADVRVSLLDDGGSDDMKAMARRHGANYIRREGNSGAKAGNINHALEQTDAPFVAVLDCDHVPDGSFLEQTLGHFAGDRIAFVQTPQYYANCEEGTIPGASWSQQSLFFGPIARGKAGHDAMFCCGTNVVFSRAALESIGGFPTNSVTEDFELSVILHEQGWRTVYVPEVLARGLGPEDMASYVSQQQRWARGCLSAIPAVIRAKLPWRRKLQYLLSASYFLTGWTVFAYMSFPVIRIATGEQPLAEASADQFLLHFAPYFGLALFTVATVGSGSYTFRAFALQSASFWIHVQATLRVILRRPGKFVVTPKQGALVRQPRAVIPALLAIAALVGAAVYGLIVDRSPATLNNVAFAALHVTVLMTGAWPALTRAAEPAAAPAAAPVRRERDEAPARERVAA